MVKIALIQKLKFIAKATLLSVFVASVNTLPTSAMTTQGDCSVVGSTEYAGTLSKVPSGSYDIYARLAYRDQVESATVAIGDYSLAGCTNFGLAELTGDSWTRVGSWYGEADAETLVLRMYSPAFSEVPGANRPSVVMMPAQQAPCDFIGTDCRVMVEGREGVLLMASNPVDQEHLRVSRPVLIDSDKVVKATYYIDDLPVYSKDMLLPFDVRYALSSEQRASVVVEYASGQKVVLSEKLPEGYVATPSSLLFRLYHTNAAPLTILLVLSAVVVGALMVWFAARMLETRYAWRVAHGFTAISHKDAMDQHRRDAGVYQFKLWSRRIIISSAVIVGLFGFIWATSEYVIAVFKVDGPSMESTYTDGRRVVVSKVPVTWEHMVGRKYVPKRGQPVVLRAEYGLVDSQAGTLADGHYIVKRVIGLPGDHVLVSNGAVTVRTKSGGLIYPDRDGSWSKTMHESKDGAEIDVVLSDDEIFIAGDNRPVSIDSRANGPIELDSIVGIVLSQL